MATNQVIASGAVSFEYQAGLIDTQAMAAEYGQACTIHIRNEGQVARDDYGSIIGRPADSVVMNLNAAMMDYQPTRRQLEKAGLREECDMTIWIAMQDFTDAGLAFDDLELKRMTVDIAPIPGETNGNRYEVQEKSRAGSYANGYLYITLGLKRG
jgi:hypothetical protein